MPAEQEPQHGPGEEPEDERGRPSWLHPDDRLWRHPSEVRAHPAPAPVAARPRPPSWLQGPTARAVPVAVLSGLAGALVCAAALYAFGLINQTVVKMETFRTGGGGGVATSKDPGPQASIPDAVEPWVVAVSITGSSGQVDGSGAVLDTIGNGCYVVTDSALFAEAGSSPQVEVTTYTGATKVAQLEGIDNPEGIAIMRVAWAPSRAPVLGASGELQTGQPVFAVGSESLAVTSQGSYYSTGSIIDQYNYVAPVSSGSSGMFGMLVADINVDPSAIGGPLVDGNGNLLGITNPVATQLQKTNLTYVTPIEIVLADVDSLVRYGHLASHPWMGIVQATDIEGPGAAAMGVAGAVQVDVVAGGSPLAKAGFVDNDVITAIDNEATPSVGALIANTADYKPGAVYQVNWLHDGHRRSADITMVTQPSSIGAS